MLAFATWPFTMHVTTVCVVSLCCPAVHMIVLPTQRYACQRGFRSMIGISKRRSQCGDVTLSLTLAFSCCVCTATTFGIASCMVRDRCVSLALGAGFATLRMTCICTIRFPIHFYSSSVYQYFLCDYCRRFMFTDHQIGRPCCLVRENAQLVYTNKHTCGIGSSSLSWLRW